MLENKYHNFFEVMKNQAEIDPYGELAKFDRNRLGLILSDIPESFLDEIWHEHSVSSDSEISLNHAGRFARFIQEAAKSNPFLNEYFDTLKNTGDISPSMYAAVLFKPEEIDLRLDRERLILTVHCITVMKEAFFSTTNDTTLRKMWHNELVWYPKTGHSIKHTCLRVGV